jgi:hypothetical protein
MYSSDLKKGCLDNRGTNHGMFGTYKFNIRGSWLCPRLSGSLFLGRCKYLHVSSAGGSIRPTPKNKLPKSRYSIVARLDLGAWLESGLKFWLI